jgi:hypothetical protein
VITLKRFQALEAVMRQAGYGPIIEWSETIAPPADADDFADRAIYVICNSGMKNAIAEPIYERCMVALREGRSAATEFGHPGKRVAIDRIWSERHALFEQYCRAPHDIDQLQELPWIGPITVFHLAKNLGADVAKPDVHLERLARRDRTTSQTLCRRLSRWTGYRVATIDTVLWRACADGLLSSAIYEREGWKAAFKPHSFIESVKTAS